jgi:hypothetical protein
MNPVSNFIHLRFAIRSVRRWAAGCQTKKADEVKPVASLPALVDRQLCSTSAEDSRMKIYSTENTSISFHNIIVISIISIASLPTTARLHRLNAH